MNTNTMTVELQPGDSLENLLALLKAGAQALNDAARMLARLAHVDPDFLAKVREAAPAFPPGFLANLLRVGEGSLHVSLLLNSAPAYAKLRQLPYTVQEQALKAGAVEVVMNEAGEALRVPLVDMKPDQVNLVFSAAGLRSADEQRAILRRKQLSESRPVAREEAFPWVLKKDRIIVTRGVELTRKDIMRMLEEISA